MKICCLLKANILKTGGVSNLISTQYDKAYKQTDHLNSHIINNYMKLWSDNIIYLSATKLSKADFYLNTIGQTVETV